VKSAQDSFLSVYRSLGPDGRHDAASILPYWMAVVGRDLGLRTRPVWFAQGRLTVEVDGEPWREEMIRLHGLLVDRLNKLLGGELVRNITYRLAAPRRQPGRAQTASGETDAAGEAAVIEDPQLRRLYTDSKRRELRKRASMKKAR
jgi:hypothetical protein